MGQSASSESTDTSTQRNVSGESSNSNETKYTFIPLCEDFKPKRTKPLLRSQRLKLKSRLSRRRHIWLVENFYSSEKAHSFPSSHDRVQRLHALQYRAPTVRVGGDSWTVRGFGGYREMPVLRQQRAPVRPWKFVTAEGYCWNSSMSDMARRRQLIRKTMLALKGQYEELRSELQGLSKNFVRERRGVRPPPLRTAPPHVWTQFVRAPSVSGVKKVTVGIEFESRIRPYTVEDVQRVYSELGNALNDRRRSHISVKKDTSELWLDTPLTGMNSVWRVGSTPLSVDLKPYQSGASTCTGTQGRCLSSKVSTCISVGT